MQRHGMAVFVTPLSAKGSFPPYVEVFMGENPPMQALGCPRNVYMCSGAKQICVPTRLGH